MEELWQLGGLPAAGLPGDQEEAALLHSLQQSGSVSVDRQLFGPAVSSVPLCRLGHRSRQAEQLFGFTVTCQDMSSRVTVWNVHTAGWFAGLLPLFFLFFFSPSLYFLEVAAFLQRHCSGQELPVTSRERCDATGRAASTWPLYRSAIGLIFPLRHISSVEEFRSQVSLNRFFPPQIHKILYLKKK